MYNPESAKNDFFEIASRVDQNEVAHNELLNSLHFQYNIVRMKHFLYLYFFFCKRKFCRLLFFIVDAFHKNSLKCSFIDYYEIDACSATLPDFSEP